MSDGHCLLRLLVLVLAVASSFVSVCHALASPNPTPAAAKKGLLAQLQKGLSSSPLLLTKPTQDAPQNLLDELNLENSIEPKTFGFKASQIPDLLTASFPAVMRLGTGAFAEGYRVSLAARDTSRYTILNFGNYSQVRELSDLQYPKQNLPLILYEFEGCPFCRKVREAVSILSLEVTFRPCPKGERVFRQEVKSKYGDASSTFPFLIDPNTGVQMFESDDIINYLFRVYGTAKSQVPWTLSPNNPLVALSAGLGLFPRLVLGRGTTYRASNPPATPLILWAYEGSPFCKLVRERLVELGIPHTQISCPRGSYNCDRLFDKTGGRFQVPYLEDPNTRVSLFESAAIIEYLEKVYGLAQPTVKYL